MSDGGHRSVRAPKVGRDMAFRWSIAAVLFVLVVFSPVILIILGWFLEPYQEAEGAGQVSHGVHEITFGVLFAIAVVGALLQRQHSEHQIAPMQQLIAVTGVFAVVVTSATGRFEWLTLIFLVPVSAAAWLHPARRSLLTPRLTPSRLGLVLAVLGLLPMLDAAIREIHRAAAQAQDHTSHWAAMATFFMVLALCSFIAAMRVPGFRATAYSIGTALVVYGVAGILFPFDASSAGNASVAPIIWGLGWVAYAWRIRDETRAVADRSAVGVLGRTSLFGLGGFVALLVVALWAFADAPNIPHNLDNIPPTGQDTSWEEAGRATCLACHSSGRRGAPVPAHGLSRSCGGLEEACFTFSDGLPRSDCLGCHAYNPDLGGSSAKAVPGQAWSDRGLVVDPQLEGRQ